MKTRAKALGKSRRQTLLSATSRRTASNRSRTGASAKASRSRSAARGARPAGRSGAAQRGGSAKRTTDHAKIRKWVEARGGHPAMVKRTERGKAPKEGVLRIDFPGFSGAGSLEEVSWKEWFDVFDKRKLQFLYQEKTASGKPSRFNKLVCP